MNQYIGARYVPLLAGEWDATKSYEYLTTVSSGNNSYTSRQNVPAGTPLTNTDYWMQTGNYGAQLTEIEEDIQTIKNTKGNLGGYNVLIIGDSYGDQSKFSFNVYSTILKNIIESEGGLCTVNCQGGAGIVTKSPEGNNLLDLYNQVPGKTSYTMVIVQGFANDINQITPDISPLINAIKIGSPNAIIYVFGCSRNWGGICYPVINKIIKDAQSMGCIAPNMAPYMISSQQYISTDKIHPTEEGQVLLANRIYGELLGNTFIPYEIDSNNIRDIILQGTDTIISITDTAWNNILTASTGITTISPSNLITGQVNLRKFALMVGPTQTNINNVCYYYQNQGTINVVINNKTSGQWESGGCNFHVVLPSLLNY